MAVVEIASEREIVSLENPSQVVWNLAWPAVALNSLQVVNTLLDRGFIGRLSSATLTGYGGTASVTFFMFSLGMAVSTGATALVSRGFGAGEVSEYRRASQESLSLAIFGGTIVALLMGFVAALSADLILPPNDAMAKLEMTKFLVAYACGLPAIFVIQTLAGCLRGVGDTRSPMYISGVQIFLHMTLNVLLIFPSRHVAGVWVPGAGLGLVGGGTALAISSWISMVGYMLYVHRTPLGHLSPFRLPLAHWMYRILRIATPAALMSCLRVLSLTAFTIVLKQVSGASAAIAAMSIGFGLESIMFMPAFGLSAAAAALVGQSLGMKRPDRAERLAWTAAHYGALVTICLAAPLFAAAPSIALFMTDGKVDIANSTSDLLRYLCASEFLFAYGMVLIGSMQGAGDTKRPLWITVFSLWGLRVPLAIVFALPLGFKIAGIAPLPFGLGLGMAGAWLAMSLTQGLQGVLAVIAFKAGQWKTQQV